MGAPTTCHLLQVRIIVRIKGSRCTPIGSHTAGHALPSSGHVFGVSFTLVLSHRRTICAGILQRPVRIPFHSTFTSKPQTIMPTYAVNLGAKAKVSISTWHLSCQTRSIHDNLVIRDFAPHDRFLSARPRPASQSRLSLARFSLAIVSSFANSSYHDLLSQTPFLLQAHCHLRLNFARALLLPFHALIQLSAPVFLAFQYFLIDSDLCWSD